MVDGDLQHNNPLLKRINERVDGGVDAVVPAQVSPDLPDQVDESLDLLKESLFSLIQGERPPSRLLARPAISRRRECGAHAGLSQGYGAEREGRRTGLALRGGTRPR